MLDLRLVLGRVRSNCLVCCERAEVYVGEGGKET